jgi:hypothetical protein
MRAAETDVRRLGECGGHFGAPAFDRGADPSVRNLGECGGHFGAPAFERAADPVSATRA